MTLHSRAVQYAVLQLLCLLPAAPLTCGCLLWHMALRVSLLPGEILLEKRYDGLSAADAHLARISDHVSAYLQIVRSQLLATVPKAVVHCTVVPAKDNLLAELQEEVAGATLAAWLLRLLAGQCTSTVVVGHRGAGNAGQAA